MKLEVELKLTPEQVAEAFCELDDDDMALVFEHIGAIGERWRVRWEQGGRGGLFYGIEWQLEAAGRHMRTCECVGELGREVLRALARGLEGPLAAPLDKNAGTD